MTAEPSGNTRVRALLEARGERGVNSTEFAELPTVDGYKPIRRVAARIDNLKKRGLKIGKRTESNGTATYFLLAEPGVEQARTVDDDAECAGIGRRAAGRPAPDGLTCPTDASPDQLRPAPAEPLAALFDADAWCQPLGYAESEAAA